MGLPLSISFYNLAFLSRIDGRIMYKLWRRVGPTYDTQRGPRQGPQHESLVCYIAQENLEEESDTEKEEEITVEKGTQVTAKEKLEEVDLGTDL